MLETATREIRDDKTLLAGSYLARPLDVPTWADDSASLVTWHCLAATLDELDYGIVVLVGDGRSVLVNRAAQTELDESHPLHISAGALRARASGDAARLHDAVAQASIRGLRRMLVLGRPTRPTTVSIVPLALPNTGDRAVLVVMSKSAVCGSLSLQGFAQATGLTSAETQVLTELCGGAAPADAAVQLGVAISTIRSQIGSIRAKTGAASISALMRQVALLPPLRGVLRFTA